MLLMSLFEIPYILTVIQASRITESPESADVLPSFVDLCGTPPFLAIRVCAAVVHHVFVGEVELTLHLIIFAFRTVILSSTAVPGSLKMH